MKIKWIKPDFKVLIVNSGPLPSTFEFTSTGPSS